MAAAKNTSKIHKVTNMEVRPSLDGADPKNYVAVLSGEKHLINLPVNGKTVKMYVEPPKTENS